MFLFLLFAFLPLIGAHSLGPIIDVGYASFLGNASLPGTHFFGGIPYAKPPVGGLRFRSPQLLDENVYDPRIVTDARNWGPLCIQQPAVVGFGSEGLSHSSVIV